MAKKKKETRNNIRSFLKYRFLISYLHITDLLQRRDLNDIFAEARQGPFCPFTFPFFSRATTFLASAFGGLRESHTLSPHPRARFFLKRGKKRGKIIRVLSWDRFGAQPCASGGPSRRRSRRTEATRSRRRRSRSSPTPAASTRSPELFFFWRSTRSGAGGCLVESQNFGRSVLACVEAEFQNYIFTSKHF